MPFVALPFSIDLMSRNRMFLPGGQGHPGVLQASGSYQVHSLSPGFFSDHTHSNSNYRFLFDLPPGLPVAYPSYSFQLAGQGGPGAACHRNSSWLTSTPPTVSAPIWLVPKTSHRPHTLQLQLWVLVQLAPRIPYG